MSELSISALVNSGGEVLQRAHASLKEQARLIDQLSGAIGDSFVQAAALLGECDGRYIVAAPERLARAGAAIAAAFEAAGLDAGTLVDPGPEEIARHLGARDLLLLIGADRPDQWQTALEGYENPVVVLGGEDLSFTGFTRVQLPVCVDRSCCPEYLLPAVGELALMALGDALIAALGGKRITNRGVE